MSLLRQMKRLQYIDFIIQKKTTGNLLEFAKKNGLSRSGLALILSEMKEMGFPIKYDKKRSSYYYAENGEMVKSLFIKETQQLTHNEMKNIHRSEYEAQNLCFSKHTIFTVCR